MSVALDYQRMRLLNAAAEQDPLAWFTHSSDHSRKATQALRDFDEVYCRAANKSGKTFWQYGVGLAMVQKRPSLDDIPLPQWRGPGEAASLEMDYEIQRLTSQKVLFRHLGGWPHRATYIRDALKTVHVQPFGLKSPSTNENGWSTLTFHSQKNLKTGTGVRADLILANEPPRRDIWEEIRKAAEAGRPIKRIIGATPIKRSEWYWLFDQYKPEAPRDGFRAQRRWIEVRWSLEHNRALSRQEKDDLLWEYAKNPATYDARVYGDYCNTSGRCPFDEKTLLLMLKDEEWAREPLEVIEWPVSRETADGAVNDSTVEVEVYEKPRKGETYYEPLDGSSGIDDGMHDPAGLLIGHRGTGDLQIRHVSPMPSYRLGTLGVGLARQYNNAVMDPEDNKWSLGIVEAIKDQRYGNLAHERRDMGQGEFYSTPGFTTDEKTRNESIAAIQDWIEAYRVGVRYAKPCRAIIECLLDAIYNDKGKYEAGPGAHDEDMILWGMVLKKCVSRRGREIPQVQKPPESPDAKLIALIRGERQPESRRPPVPQYRSRPRI